MRPWVGGAGRGLRPGSADDRAVAGGIGLLFDLAGNDRYVAQVFAQGVSYQEGLGMLFDVGAAYELSAAYFLDRGGDDHYALGNLGLGAANDHGIAVFMDVAGDDDYVNASTQCFAFGRSRIDGQEGTRIGSGLFLDLDGRYRATSGRSPLRR